MFLSHPTRVRGLKPQKNAGNDWYAWVAPHAGAWIETSLLWCLLLAVLVSHPTRVRGLKRGDKPAGGRDGMSHPTRVRGLKQACCSWLARWRSSHPTRVRGLKP